MDPAERFIEAATRPLAETNAEQHLAAQHELRERIEKPDSPELQPAAERLEADGRRSWITVLLITMAVISTLVLIFSAFDFRKLLTARSILTFSFDDTSYEPPSTLTPAEALLLYGNRSKLSPSERWKPLWDSRPDHPPYFVEYAFHYIDEHKALPPNFLKIANEIDPDNGIYLAAAAALEAEGAYSESHLKGVRKEDRVPVQYTIDDPAKHAAALDLLRQAMEKPRFSFYSEELLKERIPLLPRREDFVTQLPAIAYMAGSTAYKIQLMPLSQTLPAEIQRCGKDQDEKAYEEIKDLGQRYFDRLSRDGCVLIDPLIAKSSILKSVRSLRDAAGQLGRDQEQKTFAELDLALKPPKPPLGMNPDPEKDELENLIQRKGGTFHALSLPMMNRTINQPVPISESDLTPGRRVDHALFGRLSSLGIWAMLGIALTTVSLYRFRHGSVLRFLGLRCRDLFRPVDWCWILGLGILVPLLWYAAIGLLSPLAAHHWSMRISGFVQPAGQAAAALWMMLIAPILLTRWRLSKRAPFLGMQTKLTWIGWLLLVGLALAVPLFGLLFVAENQGTHLVYLASGLIAAAQIWLLVVSLLALFGKPQRALFRQVVARCLIPAYAFGKTLVILALPLFHQSESHWIQKDWLLEVSAEEPSLGRYEYRVTRQLQSELTELLKQIP